MTLEEIIAIMENPEKHEMVCEHAELTGWQKELKELRDKHWDECRQIAHYDNELRTATKLAAGEWISCKDKLPDTVRECVVWYTYYGLWGKSEGYGLSWYSKSNGWYKGDLAQAADDIKVLYWQPLPGKPKEESNG